jgi:hypothetical protein
MSSYVDQLFQGEIPNEFHPLGFTLLLNKFKSRESCKSNFSIHFSRNLFMGYRCNQCFEEIVTRLLHIDLGHYCCEIGGSIYQAASTFSWQKGLNKNDTVYCPSLLLFRYDFKLFRNYLSEF